jgi:hypothetical protein
MTKSEATEQPPEGQALSRKRRLMDQLTAEIDRLKREIERSKHLGSRTRILHDIEKPAVYERREVKHISVPRRAVARRELSEAKRIDAAMDYISEIKTLPLVDVLRQSKKLVFSDEWEAAYREREHIKIYTKADRLRRRNKLIREAGPPAAFSEAEVCYHRNKIAEKHRQKIKNAAAIAEGIEELLRTRTVYENVDEIQVSQSLQTRVVLPVRAVPSSSLLSNIEVSPDGASFLDPLQWLPIAHEMHRMEKGGEADASSLIVPRAGRSDPAKIFPSRPWEAPKAPGKIESKAELVQSFERFLNYFSKCMSSQSKRSVFQVSYPPPGVHVTNQHIFKKIQGEYLKCKSAKDIIAFKYRNVVVESTPPKLSALSSKRRPGLFDDEDSLGDVNVSESINNDLDLSLVLNPEGGEDNRGEEEAGGIEKINLETSFDRFLNERSRRNIQHSIAETGLHSNPKFTDFIRTPAHQEQMAWPGDVKGQKLINEFYRNFPNRAGVVPKPFPEAKERSKVEGEARGNRAIEDDRG